MKIKMLGSALVATGLIAGCESLVHDNDTLAVQGFVVPAGQTVLGNPRKDANKKKKKAPEDKISQAKTVMNDDPEDKLILVLHAEGDVIAQQTIHKPDTWPTAYRLTFNPPAVENDKDLWLDLRTVDNGKPLLVYSKKIELSSPVLFDTTKDVIVTEYEKNLEHTGNDKRFAMQLDDEIDRELATFSNEDLQRYIEEEGYPEKDRPQGAPSVFEQFTCKTDDRVNIYFAENFAVLGAPRMVLPRLTGTPVTVYRTAQWEIAMKQDANEFTYTAMGKKPITCAMNDGTYRPSVQLNQAERAPAPKDDRFKAE